MKKYEDLIYYTICESLYDEQKSSKDIHHTTTFRNLCRGIAINIEHDVKLSSAQYKILTNTISKLLLIYGEDTDTIGTFIKIFFIEKNGNYMRRP